MSRQVTQKDLYGIVDEVAKGRISRRQFLERGLAMGLSLSAVGQVLVACGNKDRTVGGTKASPLPPMNETKPKVLNLWNGASYMDAATKKNFERLTGVKVLETYDDGSGAILTELRASGNSNRYDVMIPSDFMVHVLIKSRLIEPLDMSYIPNFAGVAPQFVAPRFDNPANPENKGQKYSVPYAWGTTGIAQRTDILPDEITSWAGLWNPAYKGKISMLSDTRETLGVGLKKNGYSINTLNIDELTRAKDDLIAQKPLVKVYESVWPQRNIIGGMPLVHCWSGDLVRALRSGKVTTESLKFILPAEGIPWWVDNLCVLDNPAGRYGAHLFIDYLLDPIVQAPLMSWIGSYSPIPAAVPNIDPLVYAFAPTDAQMALPTTECYDDLGDFSVEYSNAWEEIRGA